MHTCSKNSSSWNSEREKWKEKKKNAHGSSCLLVAWWSWAAYDYVPCVLRTLCFAALPLCVSSSRNTQQHRNKERVLFVWIKNLTTSSSQLPPYIVVIYSGFLWSDSCSAHSLFDILTSIHPLTLPLSPFSLLLLSQKMRRTSCRQSRHALVHHHHDHPLSAFLARSVIVCNILFSIHFPMTRHAPLFKLILVFPLLFYACCSWYMVIFCKFN